MKSKIYLVEQAGAEPRLVRATTRAQAVAYVARTTVSAAYATQDDLVRLLARGKVVEAADMDAFIDAANAGSESDAEGSDNAS